MNALTYILYFRHEITYYVAYVPSPDNLRGHGWLRVPAQDFVIDHVEDGDVRVGAADVDGLALKVHDDGVGRVLYVSVHDEVTAFAAEAILWNGSVPEAAKF